MCFWLVIVNEFVKEGHNANAFKTELFFFPTNTPFQADVEFLQGYS